MSKSIQYKGVMVHLNPKWNSDGFEIRVTDNTFVHVTHMSKQELAALPRRDILAIMKLHVEESIERLKDPFGP